MGKVKTNRLLHPISALCSVLSSSGSLFWPTLFKSFIDVKWLNWTFTSPAGTKVPLSHVIHLIWPGIEVEAFWATCCQPVVCGVRPCWLLDWQPCCSTWTDILWNMEATTGNSSSWARLFTHCLKALESWLDPHLTHTHIHHFDCTSRLPLEFTFTLPCFL